MEPARQIVPISMGAAAYMEEVVCNINKSVVLPPPPDFGTPKEIIAKGSTYERAALYVNDFNGSETFGSERLSDKQNKKLRKLLYDTSEDVREEAVRYVRAYNIFTEYGRYMTNARGLYQREVAKLSGLIDLWQVVQIFYLTIKGTPAAIELLPEVLKEEYHVEITLQNGEVVLEAGELWQNIKEQAEIAAKHLSTLKGCIEALLGYIKGQGEPSLWLMLPPNIERTLVYPDEIEQMYQPAKAEFFRYILNRKKEDGEAVTPEEEEMAVYPDYNEVPMDVDMEQDGCEYINHLLHLWQ